MPVPSAFLNVPVSTPDAIVKLMQQCSADSCPDKIDLSIGVYKSEEGKLFVMPSVRESKQKLAASEEGHDYTNMQGIPAYREAAQEVIFGKDLQSSLNIASLQTVSGTGSIHMGLVFLKSLGYSEIYIGTPAWGNYEPMAEYAGFTVHQYQHFDPETRSLDYAALIDALETAPEKSVFILQACCHNPTGVDLTQDQWKAVAEIMKRRNLFPFMDIAYQGFSSGCKDTDAWPIRYFCEQGLELIVAQSFSKNMGLYSERTGCLHVVVNDAEYLSSVEGRLVAFFRVECSFAPAFGARVAVGIILDPALKQKWDQDVRDVRTRLTAVREEVNSRLSALQTPGDWLLIFKLHGMFWYSTLTAEQSTALKNDYHIYTLGPRINVAGLNKNNIEYFCKAVDAVVRA